MSGEKKGEVAHTLGEEPLVVEDSSYFFENFARKEGKEAGFGGIKRNQKFLKRS